ncbi:uncharacterized protein SCODWIG_03843 [Saccharomycodes ludwigii]|uniref:Uncharacterized protein n=1 Tax=Saccharomycodes ludwigii TaxID=36035 RepID=A0A376BBW6_9ASCO|nr:uncharacterized protein SCODWIG_03843 [Saccharomycodes ludwigii]
MNNTSINGRENHLGSNCPSDFSFLLNSNNNNSNTTTNNPRFRKRSSLLFQQQNGLGKIPESLEGEEEENGTEVLTKKSQIGKFSQKLILGQKKNNNRSVTYNNLYQNILAKRNNSLISIRNGCNGNIIINTDETRHLSTSTASSSPSSIVSIHNSSTQINNLKRNPMTHYELSRNISIRPKSSTTVITGAPLILENKKHNGNRLDSRRSKSDQLIYNNTGQRGTDVSIGDLPSKNNKNDNWNKIGFEFFMKKKVLDGTSKDDKSEGDDQDQTCTKAEEDDSSYVTGHLDTDYIGSEKDISFEIQDAMKENVITNASLFRKNYSFNNDELPSSSSKANNIKTDKEGDTDENISITSSNQSPFSTKNTGHIKTDNKADITILNINKSDNNLFSQADILFNQGNEPPSRLQTKMSALKKKFETFSNAEQQRKQQHQFFLLNQDSGNANAQNDRFKDKSNNINRNDSLTPFSSASSNSSSVIDIINQEACSGDFGGSLSLTEHLNFKKKSFPRATDNNNCNENSENSVYDISKIWSYSNDLETKLLNETISNQLNTIHRINNNTGKQKLYHYLKNESLNLSNKAMREKSNGPDTNDSGTTATTNTIPLNLNIPNDEADKNTDACFENDISRDPDSVVDTSMAVPNETRFNTETNDIIDFQRKLNNIRINGEQQQRLPFLPNDSNISDDNNTDGFFSNNYKKHQQNLRKIINNNKNFPNYISSNILLLNMSELLTSLQPLENEKLKKLIIQGRLKSEELWVFSEYEQFDI